MNKNLLYYIILGSSIFEHTAHAFKYMLQFPFERIRFVWAVAAAKSSAKLFGLETFEITRITDFTAPRNHEEANTCLFLHAKHAVLCDIKSINIVRSDADVVVIGVVFLIIV